MPGEIVPFNPLDKRHLGESVAQAMLRQPLVPLAGLETFKGAGDYAIYCSGDLEIYRKIRVFPDEPDDAKPIYVGKAVPPGARKGGDLEASAGRDLFKRLNEHRGSIEQSENLSAQDFLCRYLVVDDIWIPLGETLLIATYIPIWNKLIDGFGNHDPGKGRHAGARSRWDVLHPGRHWAGSFQPRAETAVQIEAEVIAYLARG